VNCKEDIKLEPLYLPEELLEEFDRADKSMNAFSANSLIVLSVMVLLVIYVSCLLYSESSLYWVIPGAVFSIIVALRFTPSMNNAGPIRQHIQLQLQERISNKVDINSLWGSDNELKVAKMVTAICIMDLAWKENSVFIPEDPFKIMMFTDDADGLDFIEDIETKFSMRFKKSFLNEKSLEELKFKDVVDYIILSREHKRDSFHDYKRKI
jgi:ABC-type antimicrobial peptide transport system permease subunit